MCCVSPTGSGGSRAGSGSTPAGNLSGGGQIGGGGNIGVGSGSMSQQQQAGSVMAGVGSRGVVRRSRSQGTRKLHKCLSTASYTEDSQATTTTISTSSSPVLHPQARHHTLLVTRQYCSFGSTVTTNAFHIFVCHIFLVLSFH